jgi:hypothetical protein
MYTNTSLLLPTAVEELPSMSQYILTSIELFLLFLTAIQYNVLSSSIIHHPSSIIHHPSSIIHHPSSIIHHPSSIIHHPSSIIHRYKIICRQGEVPLEPVFSERVAEVRDSPRSLKYSELFFKILSHHDDNGRRGPAHCDSF